MYIINKLENNIENFNSNQRQNTFVISGGEGSLIGNIDIEGTRLKLKVQHQLKGQ